MRVITEKLSAAFSLRSASAREQKPARARNPLSFLLIAAFLIIGVFSAAPAHAQIFDGDGGSGSGWIQMLRGNYSKSWTCVVGFFCNGTDDAPIADPSASQNYMAALRIALGVYSNGVLIVASIILLYHLLVMTGETAHSGVAGGKRANQVWAPIRLVLAIGLLVPLSGNVGLNSGQYITLQIIEWGSNMASNVWHTFLSHAGTGSGTDPTPHLPDTGALNTPAIAPPAVANAVAGNNPTSNGPNSNTPNNGTISTAATNRSVGQDAPANTAQLRDSQQQTAARVDQIEGRTGIAEQRLAGLSPAEQRQANYDAFQERAQKARDNKPKKKDS